MWLDSTWRSRSHNVRNEAHLGIAEHGAPFAEGQVGGDDLPFARASRTISRPLPPVASKQEPLYLISIFIGVNVAVHAVTALWAAAKTSRADVVPATYSVPSTPRSIHPTFTASNIYPIAARLHPRRPSNQARPRAALTTLARSKGLGSPRRCRSSRPWSISGLSDCSRPVAFRPWRPASRRGSFRRIHLRAQMRLAISGRENLAPEATRP